MPNIREYENPIQGFRPSETGAEAWNRAGARIDEFRAREGQEIGQGLKSLWALGHEERYIKANGQIAVSDPVAHDVRIVQAKRPFERVDLGK